jgi:Protein of unknown function (DUF3987)
MNGAGRRKCTSWIESFVDYASNLESAPIYRKWAAISIIGAALEQKVFLQTSAPLYPNLYTFLVGHPGVGKTRTIMAAAKFYRELPEPHIAPTSMSMASMVDSLVDAKRTIINLPNAAIEYNSMLICADELSAFMHKFDDEIIGGLTTFYDVTTPYSQRRRGNDLRILIKHPQLSILSGTTPSNLIKFMPENAWDQGFTSRVIMVFSDERIVADDFFAHTSRDLPADMVHDLNIINSLVGQFSATQDYQNAINNWRKVGQSPVPDHPKLLHYNTRRLAHLLKLSMVAAVDEGNQLLLTKEVFNRAISWLLEAEVQMPEVFKAGGVGADSKAMDEIYHYVLASDLKRLGVPEHRVVNFARERVPAHSVMRVLEIMERSGQLEVSTSGPRMWRALLKAQD